MQSSVCSLQARTLSVTLYRVYFNISKLKLNMKQPPASAHVDNWTIPDDTQIGLSRSVDVTRHPITIHWRVPLGDRVIKRRAQAMT